MDNVLVVATRCFVALTGRHTDADNFVYDIYAMSVWIKQHTLPITWSLRK